jgi:hypothetical protein
VSEGRAILNGISPGTIVALVDPEKKLSGNGKSGGTANPSMGPNSN